MSAALNMADLEAQLAAARAENERLVKLTQKKIVPLSFKVSEKGCVSVYGLQRFPVSLRAAQWERILDAADKIRDFVKVNQRQLDRLNAKDDDEAF